MKNMGYRKRLKNSRFAVKRHGSVYFGAFRRFLDPMLGSGSNLGCRGYFRYKKHWDTVHVKKMTDCRHAIGEARTGLY